jgi:hypothetical protein
VKIAPVHPGVVQGLVALPEEVTGSFVRRRYALRAYYGTTVLDFVGTADLWSDGYQLVERSARVARTISKVTT